MVYERKIISIDYEEFLQMQSDIARLKTANVEDEKEYLLDVVSRLMTLIPPTTSVNSITEHPLYGIAYDRSPTIGRRSITLVKKKV